LENNPNLYTKINACVSKTRTSNLAEGSLTLVGIQIHVVEKGFVAKRIMA